MTSSEKVSFDPRIAVALARRRRLLQSGTLLLAVPGLLTLAPGASAQAGDAALRLAKAVHDRPSGRDLTTLSRMELIERGRPPRVRELVTYRLDKGDGESANMMRFLQPEDIAGTGLLGVTKGDGETDQWLYLPALDRVRRISGDRKGGRFVGSDLFFEDLQERKPALDRHRLLGREAIDGVDCEVLESVPVDPDNSVYRRRVSWIDPQALLALRVDYFDRDESTPGKRWLLDKRQKTQGFWTVMDSRMVDLRGGHQTRLLVLNAKYDRRLPARLFTSRALADEQLEAEYRP